MIAGCEYCGRSSYLSEGDSCKGCGAPVMAKQVQPFMEAVMNPVIMYNNTVFEGYPMIFTPGMNIPVNLPQRSRISDFITSVAMVDTVPFSGVRATPDGIVRDDAEWGLVIAAGLFMLMLFVTIMAFILGI